MDGRQLERTGFKIFGKIPPAVKTRLVRYAKPSFTVGGMPIVTRPDGALLMVRHSYEPLCTFQGGLISRRDPIEIAISREVSEEVGLRVELLGEPTVDVDHLTQVVRVLWRARPARDVDPSSARPLSVEIEEVRWFAAREMPRLASPVQRAYDALLRAEKWRGGPA